MASAAKPGEAQAELVEYGPTSEATGSRCRSVLLQLLQTGESLWQERQRQLDLAARLIRRKR